MTHTISPTERRKIEEISGALHAVPMPYTASSIGAITDSNISGISKAHCPSTTLRPQLIRPENSSTIPSEIALQILLGKLLDHQGEHILNQEELIKQVTQWMKMTEDELQKVNKSYRNHQSAGSIISSVQKFVESFGLIITGIVAGIATGGTTLAVASIIVGGLVTIDAAFNDILKKQIAEFMKKTTGEKEDVWLYRLQLFTSTLTMALGLGLGHLQAIEIAKHVSNAALFAVRGANDWQSDGYYKEKLTIDQALELAQQLIEKMAQGIATNSEKLTKLLNIAASIEKMRTHTTQVIHA